MKERIKRIIKGTRAKEENERLRVEVKGEDSDEGANIIHEGEIKM